VVHAGHLNSEAQDRVLLPFVTACDLLLEDMEASRNDFWGEYVELVDTHRAQSVKAAEVEAAEAITLLVWRSRNDSPSSKSQLGERS
jgi:hypothetical protein